MQKETDTEKIITKARFTQEGIFSTLRLLFEEILLEKSWNSNKTKPT